MNVPSIFCSQEIASRHVAGHRSTDYSRSGCRMCSFRHAQLFEITHVANIKSTFFVQPSCQNAEVVEAFCRVAASRSNIPIDQFSSPSVAALHAPAEMPHHSLRFSGMQACRRLALAARLPSRAAPTLNPHSARCLAGAQLPATSCLGAFWTPAS